MAKFCTNCGKELSPNSPFCANCGAPVGSMPAPQQQIYTPPEQSYASPSQKDYTSPVRQTNTPTKQQAYTTPNKQPMNSGRRVSGTKILCIVLSVLLLLQTAAVVLYGWPGVLVKDRVRKLGSTAVENGVAELSGMRVDFGGTYSGSELENAKTASVDLDEGAASAGYELAFANIPEGEVTLSAPMPKDLTLAENERLYLDIGFPMLDDTGETVFVYDHIEASEQDGQIIAQITPSVYSNLSEYVCHTGGGYVSPTYSDKMRFDAQFKVKLISASQSQRFNLIFDSTRLMATSAEEKQVEALLSRMEEVYAKYEAFGFNLSRRTKWPMEIHVTTLKDADAVTPTPAQYVSSYQGINHGYMNFSRLLFVNFDLDNITSIFAHELMHFVQECYVTTQYKRLNWLDEATAVFFEKYFGGKGDHTARQYEICDGIFPASDSSRAGYARGGLVNYWAKRGGWFDGTDYLSGKDRMSGLIDLYATGGYLQESKWIAWIEDRLGAPSEYAIDFFTKLFLLDESVWAEYGHYPYTLHQLIMENAGKSKKDFSSETNPSYTITLFSTALLLEADKLTSEDGQEFEIRVPAYGARVVALDMTEKELEKLEEDAAIRISSKNREELVLLKSLSKETTTQQGASVSAPAFRESLEDKYSYLLLVVNTTDQEKTVEMTLDSGCAKIEAKWFEGYWQLEADRNSGDPYYDLGIKLLDGKTCAIDLGIMNHYTTLEESNYATASYVLDPVERTLLIEGYSDFPNGLVLWAHDKSEGSYGADYIALTQIYQDGKPGRIIDDVIRMK